MEAGDVSNVLVSYKYGLYYLGFTEEENENSP